jgi:hypothetical protein
MVTPEEELAAVIYIILIGAAEKNAWNLECGIGKWMKLYGNKCRDLHRSSSVVFILK